MRDAAGLPTKAIVAVALLASCWLGSLPATPAFAQNEGERTIYTAPGTKGDQARAEDVQQVRIHPAIGARMACTNHAVGERLVLADAYGKDCMVTGQVETGERQISSLHRGDGLENENYFAWEKPVLAPFDGVVVSVDTPSVPNPPGTILEDSETGRVEFERDDGVHVIYAHVRGIGVAPGDRVTAGQQIARVGNNGNSFMPHVHIGAWKGKTPFQIRFDLKALGCLRGDVAASECE